MRCHYVANDNDGQVVAFPLSRQAAVIRRTVDAVAEKQGREADAYWHGVIADMREKMTAIGIAEDSIECELRTFSNSVFSEIGNRCA